MKKSEILDLIKDIAEDADIDEVVLSNGFAKPITDVEGLNNLLASNKDIQGIFDKKVTGGIDQFKKNGMQKLIEAEVLKRTGDNETPEQKKIRELEATINSEKAERLKAERVAKFKDVLVEKKIPSKLAEFLLNAEDDDVINANIQLFEDSMKSYVDDSVKERIGEGAYTPPGGNGDKGKSTGFMSIIAENQVKRD